MIFTEHFQFLGGVNQPILRRHSWFLIPEPGTPGSTTKTPTFSKYYGMRILFPENDHHHFDPTLLSHWDGYILIKLDLKNNIKYIISTSNNLKPSL